MKRIVRLTALLLGWIILGAFGGLLLAVGLPNLFHAKSLTVMSGSMEPTISTGDVVVAQQIVADGRPRRRHRARSGTRSSTIA